MATRLITNDATLKTFLPNAFATVEGETSFYDKVLPWLDTAEKWLFHQFIGDDFAATLVGMQENEPVKMAAKAVVAHEAMRKAVPALDLVLTPNGFGIVSNQNVAPASKERVERLILSLETSRDDAIELLIKYLFEQQEWYESPIRGWFTMTLFPNIDLANICGFTEHRWQKYLGLRIDAITIERGLAEEFISPEQMEVFHNELCSMEVDLSLESSLHLTIIRKLRAIVADMLRGHHKPVKMLVEIVDTMRRAEGQFNEFKNSRTALLFDPPVFENKRYAHGYFF